MKKRIEYLKNFGFTIETTVIEPGINAKMNELQAAFGLLQLKYVDKHIAKRKIIADTYRQELACVPGIRFHKDIEGVRHGYPYFPILIDLEKYGHAGNELYQKLKDHNIFGRRYFYPLISNFPTYRGLPSAKPENLLVATELAEQVLCLPINPTLNESEILSISKLISNR